MSDITQPLSLSIKKTPSERLQMGWDANLINDDGNWIFTYYTNAVSIHE